MRPRKLFFPACLALTLVGLLLLSRLARRAASPVGPPGTPTLTVAGSPSHPDATTTEPRVQPSRYTLFQQDCTVLAMRDEPVPDPGLFRRAWLVELAPFGRVRIEETLRRGDPSSGESVVGRDVFVAGEVLVTPRPDVAGETLPAVFRRAGAASWERLPASDAWLVRFPEPTLDTLPRALATLAGETTLVQRAEGNGLGQGGLVPNDPRFGEQYQLRNVGQAGGLSGADIRAVPAWDIATSASSVVVAVIDSGLDYLHPDLAENTYRDAREISDGADNDGNGFIDDFRGWDFVNNDNDPLDDHNHGTHVSGAIGARGNNGVGVSGVAWNVQMLPVKVLTATNVGSTANLLSGINYARLKGATIMNLSLTGYPFSAAVSSAIDAAEAAGVLMVICAGNRGANNDVQPDYPSCYPQANIISVANTTNADLLNAGSFLPSNYGAATVDLAAPGTNVLSTLRSSGYGFFTGTSMSAPLVAGTAALLRGLRPDASVAELRDWIFATADRMPALAGKCVTGGRLNVAAALQLAAAPRPPVFATEPKNQSVTAGQDAVFSASAAGTPVPLYQWRKEGVPIAGATHSTLVLRGVQLSAAGSYSVVISNTAGSVTSSEVILTVNAAALSRLANLSIRTRAGTGDQTLIVGFVVGGAGAAGTKPLLLRGIGPALANFGVSAALQDPLLGLFNAAGRLEQNDDWNGDPQIASVAGAVGAFPLEVSTSKDAALYRPSISREAYSMQISGVGGMTGIALAEIYDATPTTSFTTASTPRLINISARAQSGTGDDVMIAGFVVAGDTSKNVLVRAVGPSLRAFGLNDVLEDPKLELFTGATKLAENNDWGGGVVLTDAFGAVGAFRLETTSRDAALLASLPAGSYTVQASGATGGSGIVLIEVYEMP